MRKRRTTKRTAIAACGALLLVFLALALFLSLLVPDYSFAQREKQVTNVNFVITMDHEGDWPGSMGVVSVFIGEEITVDSTWAAHAEASYTAEEYFPTQSEYAPEGGWECELKGDYSYGRKELTGTIKVSGEYQEPSTTLTQTENFEGTLKLSFNRDPMVAKEPPYESGDSYWFDYDNPIGTGKITGKEEISYVRGEQVESSSNDISINVEAYILVGGEKTGTTEGDSEEGQEGEGGDQKSGEGSKIPGPGSWWEWLIGTVMAGAITAGIGLLSTLFGAIPPSDAPPLAPTGPDAPPSPGESIEPGIASAAAGIGLAGTTFGAAPPLTVAGGVETPLSPWASPEPQEPGLAAGTVDPFSIDFDPYQVRPQNPLIDNLISQTIGISLDDLFSLPGYFTDKGKWIFNEATDMDNLKEMSRGLKELTTDLDRLPDEMARGAEEYIEDTVKDPSKPLKDLEEAKKAGAAFIANDLIIPILNDPVGTLKTILGTELWENAMDPRRPMPERFAYSALATLNTIGLLEGASGLKNWLMGAGGKEAAAGLVDDAAKGLGKAPKTKAIPKVKARTGFFDELDKASKGKAKTAWANETNKAGSKVQSFKKAMRSGDMQERTKAILEIQKDPLAIQELNTKDPRVIKSFNKQLKNLHKDASKYTRESIASEMGVEADQVEFFNATNPKAPGVKVKGSMDKDLTPRWGDKDGVLHDYPDRKAQELYDNGFYEAAGSPKGTTPKQLGKDCRNVAVDRHSAEAFGMSPDDWNEMQLGKPTSSTETVARTMEYKSNEAFARADNLANSGDVGAAMKERFLGQRETAKSFKNQVQGRAKYLGETNPERLAPFSEEIAQAKRTVDEMDRMIQQNASPLQIDDFLRSRNTTAEDLTNQIADIYRKLTPQ